MKELTAMDLYFLVKELKILENSKVDQVYQKGKDELTLQFHVFGSGKKILKIFLPSMLYITKYKGKQPDSPPGFCTFLRRRLKNSKLISLKQHDFERLLHLTFETHTETYHMIIELFSDGNVILCDTDFNIISPLLTQNWKDRKIRGGIPYHFPQKDFNFLKINKEEFKKALESSEMMTVKALATVFGLGGKYSEELVARANLPRDTTEYDVLYSEAQKMLSEEIQPHVSNFVLPFKFITKDAKPMYDSFNEALDEELTEKQFIAKQDEVVTKKEKDLKKIQNRIKNQETQITEMGTKIEENKEKAETIYHNYQLLTDILKKINKARKSHEWADIKEKLKGHPIIKDIDPKNKTILVEV